MILNPGRYGGSGQVLTLRWTDFSI